MIDKVKEDIVSELHPIPCWKPFCPYSEECNAKDGEYCRYQIEIAEKITNILVISKALEIYQQYLDGKLVELDDKQKLPTRKFYDDWGGESGCGSYQLAQQDMLKANWKRVKKND